MIPRLRIPAFAIGWHPVRHFLPALLGLLLGGGLAGGAPVTVTSSQADQESLAVTVYNVNLGLVKDRRTVRLPAGSSELRFMDVAAQVIPASVLIGTGEADNLRVLEQNYEYDLLSPQKLLDKYVGKEVRLYQQNPYSEREEVVTATVLANNNGPVFQIGTDVTYGHPGRILFPGVPDSLIAQPTLVWLLESGNGGAQTLEASYLTNGLTWKADYVLTLGEGKKRADLAGWVTIDNRSGATYPNARLQLVAGDVHRVREAVPRPAAMKAMAAEAAAAPFQEEGLFEYHLYTLERATTLKENQSKQISLVAAAGIPVRREYLFRGEPYYYQSQLRDVPGRDKVAVFLEFDNKKESGLGMPLPKGVVRVYLQDRRGTLQFIGEDAIDHRPKDETVRLRLGNAFDVTAQRTQTDWRKVASDSYEAAFAITLRNHKEEDITVKVVEPLPGEWKILESTHEAKKGEAFAAEFQVPVAKGKEAVLRYRVRLRY